MSSQIAISGAENPDPNTSTTDAKKGAYCDTPKQDAIESYGTDHEQSVTKVTLLLISVFLSMFLVALDRTIISTV